MASNYAFIEPGGGFPSISNSGTFNTSGSGNQAPLAFGLIAGARDPTYGYAEFMFVAGPAAGTVGAGDAVLLLPNTVQQLVSGSTASQGAVGIAVTSLTAASVWGWAQVQGVCDYAHLDTAGTGAVGAACFIGTTAGQLQTTAGATGYIINGIKVSNYTTTAASKSAILNLYWPCYDGRNQ